MIPRSLYRALSWFWMGKALSRGLGAFLRQRGRAYIVKHAAMLARKVFRY